MSKETGRSAERSERKELPIERGFPIERINEIAQKESRAKQWYRPIYTMHKWWARRLGCVFRAICLYSLLDDPEKASIRRTSGNGSITDYGTGSNELQDLIDQVDMTDPESLWGLYSEDVNISDKKVLDPFMGGGTSLVESSRFGVESVGYDLNPVAWFVTKKEIEAGQTDVDELEAAYQKVQENVSEDILSYYKTSCPNGGHTADVMYDFWVKEVDCVSCGECVPLFHDYRVGKGRYENKGKYNVLDPTDWSVITVDDWQSPCESPATGKEFDPSEGTVTQGDYSCQSCGQKYNIAEAVQEQNGFDSRLYAVEYYCSHCDDDPTKEKHEVKGYKSAEDADKQLFNDAKTTWESREDLHEYVPDVEIPLGIMTDSSAFEGGIGGGHNLLDHGYERWTDMYNERQLLCLSLILKEIDEIDNQNIREYLLMAFSECLNYNTLMTVYNPGRNLVANIFKSNSFDVPHRMVENNVWGTEYGTGMFTTTWEMVKRGVEYAQSPTERYIENGETKETESFKTPIGKQTDGSNIEIFCDDARKIDTKDEFDLVLTDPPYYDNIIYSEISDFFYVWLRILLKEEYETFQPEKTPRAESIVANPAQGKGAEEFESELSEAFAKINEVLKEDGALIFTYHHSESESWGELLQALCEQDFEVTATYPINADEQKFIGGESVSFDIVIVARPAAERIPTSWNSLRREIYRTAKQTRQQLEENRELSRGDIGVIEMGECFHEYSKHHGEVVRAGEPMSAKQVVDEIYGIIQEGSEIGEIDVFLDLLETPDATYNDLNKLTRGTDANPDQMEDMQLYRMESGDFILGTWDDEKRMAYIQERVNGNDKALNALDKAQFLRYRYEQGKSTQNYLSKWDIDDELRELCEGLADATGDDIYQRILGADTTLGDY